jgi:3,4-dihydroxy 2-butanone 4-phosphate synthase / GTP cyclohydrolase II
MGDGVRAAVAAIARGEPVIVTDDIDRENEADVVMAADAVDARSIAFLAVKCRGLICLSLEPEWLDMLNLGPMVPGMTAETNFTVSIDLDIPGSTGISAADRARTIRRAVDPCAQAADFRRPGHVFPLSYTRGGVLARRGHTEASVDLARMAGRRPAGVLCEVMNDDGTMSRGASLEAFARDYGLVRVSIAELCQYRQDVEGDPYLRQIKAAANHPARVTKIAETILPNRFGRWRTLGFLSEDGLEHVAMVLGSPGIEDSPLVRIHSECLTGDALRSERCDCGSQLEAAMELIQSEGSGVIIYVRGHEGRGIGLLPKLQAYALQDRGLDTVDANLELGYAVDSRDFASAAGVLQELGLKRVRLLTNNPKKLTALAQNGICVTARIPVRVGATPDNVRYLDTKHRRLGHHLERCLDAAGR